MENHKNSEILTQINYKLGFDVSSYNKLTSSDAHEQDNLPNPFDKLSLDELLYLREHGYLLSAND